MAIGLASMNPVVGTSNSSGYIINNMYQDRDLTSGWGKYYLTNTLDMDNSKIIGIDRNNRMNLRDKKSLYKSMIEYYEIKDKDFFNICLEEVIKPYNQRPYRDDLYFLEYFNCFNETDIKYQPLLEKIELDKFSKIISSDADNIKAQFNGIKNTKKDSTYTPDRGYPQGTDNLSSQRFPILCSSDILIRDSILSKYPKYISIYEDQDGYYAFNEITNMRTCSCESMKDIYIDYLLEMK